MRLASLSYVKQAVEARWNPRAKVKDDIANAKKSIAARYLYLKSDHAVTGAHLLRIEKVGDAQCWWCGGSRPQLQGPSSTSIHLTRTGELSESSGGVACPWIPHLLLHGALGRGESHKLRDTS